MPSSATAPSSPDLSLFVLLWTIGEPLHNLGSLDFVLSFGFVSSFVFHEVPNARWGHFGFPNAREMTSQDWGL